MIKSIINKIKKKIAQTFPSLGKIKRFTIAFIDAITDVKKTYSQHNEDYIIYEIIKKYNLKNAIYIDVGANHPTSISNTYLFYRLGYYGICIEPNYELVKLFRKFRKKDIVIPVGCSNKTQILQFYHSKVPVLSSFKMESFNNHIQTIQNYWYKEYLPVFKLDHIIASLQLKFEYIFLLSIDVEGLDFEVLEGANETLKNTLLVCIEYNSIEKKELIHQYMIHNNFKLEKDVACNFIFTNNDAKFSKYLIQ